MKTIVYEKYGPPEVLTIRQVPKPTPKKNEVVIRVRATTVTVGDTIMRSFNLPVSGIQALMARLCLGIRKPRRQVLGMELSGDIVETGSQVTRFSVGDAVIASTFSVNFGGYAEYKCMPENGVIVHKPENLSYEEAAAVPGGCMTALRCLRKANSLPGQNMMIYGASGAVGTNAVQIASHHFGAQVTAVCSTANLDLVRSLGASHVIDYKREDFTAQNEPYDVIFDAVGKMTRPQVAWAKANAGTYLNVHKAAGSGGERLDELNAVIDLIETGKLKPVIDRCYAFDEIVEAHRYVDQGHKKGNVAVVVASDM